jgi:hypothetical protein
LQPGGIAADLNGDAFDSAAGHGMNTSSHKNLQLVACERLHLPFVMGIL